MIRAVPRHPHQGIHSENPAMHSDPSPDKQARSRLIADIALADAMGQAGRFDEAAQSLHRIASAPDVAALGSPTLLGLPRKLHSAWVRLAKRRNDRVQLVGLRAMAVPPDDLSHDLFGPTLQSRAALVAAASWPVPRVIHQIWIGGAPPPACRAWADHAARHGWAYRLWDEDALAQTGVTADPVWHAMRIAGDLPGAVDVARYHVLVREGGIYLDCDWFPARQDVPPQAVFPAQGLAVLAEPAPRLVAQEGTLLSNALISAPAGHPALKHLIASLPAFADRLPGAPAWWATGPVAFTLAARRGPVTLLDSGMVAGSLPRGGSPAEAEAFATRNRAADGAGFLLAWKGW